MAGLGTGWPWAAGLACGVFGSSGSIRGGPYVVRGRDVAEWSSSVSSEFGTDLSVDVWQLPSWSMLTCPVPCAFGLGCPSAGSVLRPVVEGCWTDGRLCSFAGIGRVDGCGLPQSLAVEGVLGVAGEWVGETEAGAAIFVRYSP